MSGFVDGCRREWDRLGVPDAVANEMAADLAADLAEAEAEGASAEEVLGNGVFDATSFAASWATARGVVPAGAHPTARTRRTRRARWWLAASAGVSVVVTALGLAILARRSSASAVGVAFHQALPKSVLLPWAGRLGRGFPGPVLFRGGSVPEGLGLVLVVAGLLGLGLTLWLWRPWSTPRRCPPVDDNVGLPSYL